VAWSHPAKRWGELTSRTDPALVAAASEVRAAIAAAATNPTGWATPEQLASRLDLPKTVTNQVIPLAKPARRGPINLADDVIATTNQAVAAAAQLANVLPSIRSSHQADRGRSAKSRPITRPHDPAPRGPRR
jgi:hypothetical protein